MNFYEETLLNLQEIQKRIEYYRYLQSNTHNQIEKIYLEDLINDDLILLNKLPIVGVLKKE